MNIGRSDYNLDVKRPLQTHVFEHLVPAEGQALDRTSLVQVGHWWGWTLEDP